MGDRNPTKKSKYEEENGCKVRGVVVLMKKNLLGVNDVAASVVDRFDEIRGRKVALRLISTAVDPDSDAESCRGKLGKPEYLEDWVTKITPMTSAATYNVTFEWSKEMGYPGAFTIANFHHSEFYLKNLTLEDVPGHGRVHFVCNSWVYHAERYNKDRIFFTNQTYLPSQTPPPLRGYREEELENLRGTGTGKLEEWDRVYDYDVYNDLGDPDKGPEHERPILGGSTEYPYPRRGRTGRPLLLSDPRIESRIPLYNSLSIYVPRDERFSHLKMSDFVAYALKSIFQFLAPGFKDLFDKTPDEFDSFEEVLQLYDGASAETNVTLLEKIRHHIPVETIKELLRSDGEKTYNFPLPQVIREDKDAWRSDEEFGREMLAGINPVVIQRLQEFPPTSKLNPELYGRQSSKISEEHIIHNLEGLTVAEAIRNNKLYILDHHDSLMPYLRRINTTAAKTYATRTVLFLKEDGTLRPVAIELSLPHPEGDHYGAVSRVCTPAEDGVEGAIWLLAKAYVAVDDSGYHQLISHWLNTHASIEPFIIATNRQLSVLHPIHKLLQPHFRDTMNINALARQSLICAGGFVEITVFPGKYSLEMSSMVYKDWVFPEQSLPGDLIKRGVAIKDSSCPHGVRLLIEDYPYAVDGLEIWGTIKTWVQDYCNLYYKTDEMVQEDPELQAWWTEIREKGHGDKKDEPWWPKMQSRKELIESCTTIIWVASALHAALNFGQYPYGGYLPNRPATSRRFIPDLGTPEYEEMKLNPEKAYLKTITSQMQSVLGISLVEILSRHSSDEIYLGQRDSPEWTADTEACKAFERFGERLKEVEQKFIDLNNDKRWRNRSGPVKMPYTLLYPSSEIGLTGRGIPNSISM
ncbi:probable linoleate 9S-lipoxygenase 5 isoform X1 [Salvia splendens]|uniref:probable linoleate 9S-lipoxygenase 5 isoform X1 n=1 Tax=Salvia splendens TaxID=180675 RepID=UPI001C2651A3|nr:probable linoleate 9S-lipoxygenase 5 isoform X1 [Salvia splendens]